MAPKIPASAKGEVETHIARLRELAAGEDYDAIERATKDVRHVVDAYLPFWKSSLVREYAEAKGSPLRFQKPLPQHWTILGVGRAGFSMWATVSLQEQEVSAQLVINTDNPKADFRQLQAMKAAIEAEAGEAFTWREQPEKVQSRIELRRSATPGDITTWPELQSWLVQKLELIQRVFGPRLKTLILAEAADDEADGGEETER